MLFIGYYRLADDVEMDEVIEAAQELTESEMWPPDGMEIIRWDTTVNKWGVTIFEADDYETVNRAWEMWRASVPGMSVEEQTAPAAPVEESLEQMAALHQELPT